MDFRTCTLMAILVSGTFGHLRRHLFLYFEVPQMSEFASQHCLSNPDQTLTHSIKAVCEQAGVQTLDAALVPVDLILGQRTQVCLLV